MTRMTLKTVMHVMFRTVGRCLLHTLAEKFFQYQAAKFLSALARPVILHTKASRSLKLLHHRLVENVRF